MSKSKSPGVFSREFKLGIVCRLLAGETVSALGRELKLSRKALYEWRDRFLSGDPLALRGRGRPPRAASGAAAPAPMPARLTGRPNSLPRPAGVSPS
jgi:transposase-like protein